MGGGEGAKERRRLKRLNQGDGTQKRGLENGGNSKRNEKRQKTFLKDNRSNSEKLTSRSQPKTKLAWKKKQIAKKEKDPKKKKPKHLKRKLEQLAEDSDARKEILNEMSAWEEKKKEFSQNDKRLKSIDKRATEAFTSLNVQSPDADPENKAKLESFESEIETTTTNSAKELNNGSDSDESVAEPRRERGRRRRGRKDTSNHIKESSEDTQEEMEAKEARQKEIQKEIAENLRKGDDKNSRKDRYCLGRKPITDFAIGNSYTGKIVYVKSFGIFLDIGCHSDAFCHVSRLSDDYVESPETVFKEGDEVNARIVEIDRKQKKITVSLQSEARIEDERASMEARQQRKDSRKSPASKKKAMNGIQRMTEAQVTPSESKDNVHQIMKVASPERQRKLEPADESTMTPAELKRARKLARRAARREQAVVSLQ